MLVETSKRSAAEWDVSPRLEFYVVGREYALSTGRPLGGSFMMVSWPPGRSSSQSIWVWPPPWVLEPVQRSMWKAPVLSKSDSVDIHS